MIVFEHYAMVIMLYTYKLINALILVNNDIILNINLF